MKCNKPVRGLNGKCVCVCVLHELKLFKYLTKIIYIGCMHECQFGLKCAGDRDTFGSEFSFYMTPLLALTQPHTRIITQHTPRGGLNTGDTHSHAPLCGTQNHVQRSGRHGTIPPEKIYSTEHGTIPFLTIFIEFTKVNKDLIVVKIKRNTH